MGKRVTVWHRFKCSAVDLPCFAPQKQRVTLAHCLKEVRANVIVPERHCPPAVSEAALGVFFCATRRLHDIVQRHKLCYNEVAHDYLRVEQQPYKRFRNTSHLCDGECPLPVSWKARSLCGHGQSSAGGFTTAFTELGWIIVVYEYYGTCSNAWGTLISGSLRKLITMGKDQPNAFATKAVDLVVAQR